MSVKVTNVTEVNPTGLTVDQLQRGTLYKVVDENGKPKYSTVYIPAFFDKVVGFEPDNSFSSNRLWTYRNDDVRHLRFIVAPAGTEVLLKND